MAQMNRIVGHHTGGRYHPNATDKRAYHLLVDGEGAVHSGQFAIKANAPGRIRKGHYAAHTRALNTGSIGISLCAMHGGIWSDPHGGKYPVSSVQADAFVNIIAKKALEHRIPCTRRTILTHAEVEITLGVWQRNKWDLDYDPWGSKTRDPVEVGDKLRSKVIKAMGGQVEEPYGRRKVIRRGSRGGSVKVAQAALGIADDGIFGPMTHRAVVSFQRRNDLLPDGIVGRMTWGALLPLSER